MAKKKSTGLSTMVDRPMAYKPTAEDKARERRYQAEDDIRTMERAEEIKKDKARVTAMKEVAKEKIQTLKKVC